MPELWMFVALLLLANLLLLLALKGKTMQAKFTLTFNEVAAVPPITLATTTFNGTVGQPETGSIGASGGSGGPYAVTVDPTTPLPLGVTLDALGNVGGTPTAAGTTAVNITVADSQG